MLCNSGISATVEALRSNTQENTDLRNELQTKMKCCLVYGVCCGTHQYRHESSIDRKMEVKPLCSMFRIARLFGLEWK
jgi:hypothetical protein